MIIALANRKGGVGKTTSSVYLAAVLRSESRNVLLVDTDPEAGAKKMADAGLLPYPVEQADLRSLNALVKAWDGDVVIDTPPNDGEIIYKAAGLADEVIVPIAATGYDLSRLTDTLLILADVEEMRNRALTRVLLTRMQSGKLIAREVVQELEDREVPMFKQHIRYLTRYEGFTTPEFLDEYRKVYQEVGANL